MRAIRGPMTLLCSFVAALLAAGLATPVAAQQDSVEPDRAERVEESLEVEDSFDYLPTSNTIVSKLPTDQVWTPANIGAVDSVLIEEQNGLVLGDALSNLSGVNVQTGSGVFDFFVLRGFDSLSSALVLTDGVPEPESTFYQLYNVERVEIFKGPAGFLYGSNPLAGVVNLVRKQPLPHGLASFGIGWGSFHTTEASFDLNAASAEGRTSFRLNGLWRESDGYRDGRDYSVSAIHPVFAWRPNERKALTVSLELSSSDYRPDAGLPLLAAVLPDVPRERSYASPLDQSRQDIVRIQVDYEVVINERFTVRDKLYSRELDWDTRGTLISGVLDFGTGPQVLRVLLDLDDRQNLFGNQLELLWRTDRHQLLAGIELMRYADDFSLDVGFLPVMDLFEPVETPGAAPIPIPGQASSGDSETTIIAPYFVDQIRLSDRARLMLGARFDSIDFDDRLSGESRSDSEISPLVGFVFELTPETWLYSNVARSFAPASVRVAGERQPERSRQFEIGVRRNLAGGRLHTILAAYQLERDNIAIPDDNGFTQQAGDQRSRGLEAELGGEFGKGFLGTLSYAYNEAELIRFAELVQLPFPPFFAVLDRSGNTPAFAPQHLFRAWLSRTFDSGLGVAGGLRWVDTQFIAEDNVAQIDGHALLDAAVYYGLDRWRVSLNLKNLTDEEYGTRGFGSFSVIPGPPFSATVRIEYRM